MTQRADKIAQRIREIYASGKVFGADGRTFEITPHAVTPDRGDFIRKLCLSEGARSAVEIGMAWGLSTLHLLEALVRNGADRQSLVVMDPYQSATFHGAGLRTIRDAEADSFVEFYNEPSYMRLPKLLEEKRQFDFAFIDGSHFFDQTFVELFYVDRLLKPGGVVVLDDTWAEPVRMVCQFAESNYDYVFLGGHRRASKRGLSLWGKRRLARPLISAYRKPMNAPERSDWLYFVPFFSKRWERRVTREHT